MSEPVTNQDSGQPRTRSDEVLGMIVILVLPVVLGLTAMAFSGPDLMHASPLLFGIGLLLIGVSLILVNALVKGLSGSQRP